MKKTLLPALLIATVYLLHQDFWNWERTQPLVLGFLPVGLAYHVGYSLMASVAMAVLVRHCWPAQLEEEGRNDRKSGRNPP